MCEGVKVVTPQLMAAVCACAPWCACKHPPLAVTNMLPSAPPTSRLPPRPFLVQICGPGVPIAKIGEVCQAVAQKHKLTVVRDFIGHGVGTVFHAEPQVLHHKNTQRDTMQVGALSLWQLCMHAV